MSRKALPDTIGIDVHQGVPVYTLGEHIAERIPAELVLDTPLASRPVLAAKDESPHTTYYLLPRQIPKLQEYFASQSGKQQ